MLDRTKLFDAIREIKSAGVKSNNPRLTQADVNRINRILDGVEPALAGSMKTSKVGIDLIHKYETFQENAYPDPGSRNGLPVTIGWGSTSDLDGNPIKLGTRWTREMGDAKFAQDLAEFEEGVNRLIGSAPTTQNQFDALVSLAYNVGLDIDEDTRAEGLGDSTLLRKHLAGDYAGAAREFSKWVFNDGKRLRGLERRRADEAALYSKE